MENYKIKVNNEAESKEAQELFEKLGYRFSCMHFSDEDNSLQVFHGGSGSLFEDHDSCSHQELSLPQLLDLVVLHRNDVSDANWVTEGDDQIYKDSNGKSFIFREQGWDELQRHEMRQAMWEKIKPKPQPTEHEQGLISGADAKLAWANGEDLQIDTGVGFEDLTDNYYLAVFDRETNKFRRKPRTIKLEIEIPAPFELKVGDIYYFITTSNSQGFDFTEFEDSDGDDLFMQFGAYRNASDARKIVAALRGGIKA